MNAPYTDLAAVIAGGVTAPTPDTLRRNDGHALAYSGHVNVIYGDPETGKTWVALAAATEAINHGGKALILDMDNNGPGPTVHRLRHLGLDDDAITDPDRLRYAAPESAGELQAVANDAAEWKPSVVVVDSVGDLMATLGLDSNNNDDYTRAHHLYALPYARAGAAVILIDHIAKAGASRSYGAAGAMSKRKAIDGVSLLAERVGEFAPGVGGVCKLRVMKDRQGGVRVNALASGVAGVFRLGADGGWGVDGGVPGQGRSSQLDDDVEALLSLPCLPSSGSAAARQMGWQKRRALAAFRVASRR